MSAAAEDKRTAASTAYPYRADYRYHSEHYQELDRAYLASDEVLKKLRYAATRADKRQLLQQLKLLRQRQLQLLEPYLEVLRQRDRIGEAGC